MQTVTFGRRAAPPGESRAAAWAPPAPPRAATPSPSAASADGLMAKVPVLTFGVLAVLGLIFAVELLLSAGAGRPGQPSHAALFRLGGVSRALVLGDGQAWRLLTAPLLHANLGHLVGNAVALFFAGLLLEPLVGRRWFAAIYLVGGVGGCLGSIFLNEHSVLGVGASGAIMALLACTLVMSFHIACYDRRVRMRSLSLRVGVPALLPLSHAGGHVDYSAHFGGAIAGVLMGYLLQVVWSENEDRPPLRPYAGAVAWAFGAISLAAVATVALLPASLFIERLTPGLAPPDDLPQTDSEIARGVGGLIARYPDDPRLHALAAAGYVRAKDNPSAEAEFETALASPLLAAPEIPPGLADRMRMALVGLYLRDGKLEDARTVAAPICQAPATPERQRIVLLFGRAHLCEAGG